MPFLRSGHPVFGGPHDPNLLRRQSRRRFDRLLCLLGLSADSAAAGSAYDAIARTDVSTVTIGNESIPTGIEIEAGGPVARVAQDGVGIRDASAALPYAGDTVAGLPGLGAS